jgi:membrane protease YdiL (CAAX protease family)
MPTKNLRAMVLLSCWIAILSASDLPAIARQVLSHGQDSSLWIPATQAIGFIVSLGLAFASPLLRSVRGFLWALLAFAVGDWACFVIESTSLWIQRVGGLPVQDQMIARSVLSLIPAVLMTLTLTGSGLGRKDVFLAKGNLKAPATMPFGIQPVRWTILGPALIGVFVLPLILQLTLTLRPDFSMATRALRALPVILVFATLNSASEEFRFRSVLIARVQPAVGTGQTLLMTSALFGLGHWFGHPSGPTGVLLAGFAGWFWGKAMIETKGFTWSWLIHAAQDVAIVAFIIMAGR